MEDEEEMKNVQDEPAKSDELFEMLDKSSRDGFNLEFKKAFSIASELSNSEDDAKGVKRNSPNPQKTSNRPLKLQKLDVEEAANVDEGIVQEQRTAAVTKEETKPPKEETNSPPVFRVISYRDALLGPALAKDAKNENTETHVEPQTTLQQETLSETSSVTDNSDIEARESEHADDSDLGEEGTEESHQGSVDGSPNPKENPKQESRGRTTERESNEIRLAQRDKQIRIGKNTPEYTTYKEATANLPKEKKRIHTPDKYQIISKRCWDGQVIKWRKALHRFYETLHPTEEQPQSPASESNQLISEKAI